MSKEISSLSDRVQMIQYILNQSHTEIKNNIMENDLLDEIKTVEISIGQRKVEVEKLKKGLENVLNEKIKATVKTL